MSRSDDKSGNLWVHKPAHVEFETSVWHLVWGAQGVVGNPIEAFVYLYAKKDHELIKISKPEDMNKLNGLSVSSPAAAVSYVRLFTQPETYMAFTVPHGVEKNIESAKVTQEDRCFVVVRHLLLEKETKGKGYPLVYVKEQVSFDGKYTLLEQKVLSFVPFADTGFRILQ